MPKLIVQAAPATCHQLEVSDVDLLAIERDDLWCVPTAEASLTSLRAQFGLEVECAPPGHPSLEKGDDRLLAHPVQDALVSCAAAVVE